MENTNVQEATQEVKMPITYDDLKQSLIDSGRPYDFDMIDRAYALAEKAHGTQRRRSGEPYICHPLSVAQILVELGMDSESIAAALMHDVAEDTPVTVAEIKQKFGPEVALLVDGVTKLTQIKFSNVEDRQAENLRKMLLAMSQDVRVMIIKLCDRLHNMRTGDAWPEQKRRDKALETMEVYAPIAHRLGISNIKEELEDRSLHYLDPVGYETIRDLLNKHGDEFLHQVEQVGVAVIGQSGNLTPADKKLYALRDVTATVDSLPLITSSIMSKKLAAGSHSIVLDVKVGSGAFMKTLDAGRELAEHMVTIGKACGRNVTAVLTNMDVPLGHRIGNALEVEEAVEILRGEGCPDLQEVCTVLASNMLMLCNGWDEETARAQVKEAIASGRAFEQMKRWVAAQGGDPAVLDDTSKLPQAAIQHEILAPCGGYLSHMDAQKIGEASALLGAGRQTKEDVIDFAAGVVLKKKTGERVEAGEVLAVLHANRAESVPAAEAAFLGALQWSDTAPEKQPLILGIVR